ncbi:MAG: hypothetical protein M3167_11035 [Acidobacteriota bacterium]|nr:hypothetical protein [Acidobacteriota bacterium]
MAKRPGGRGAFPVILLAFLAASSLGAQEPGGLRAGAESYHDTLPGESVNGVSLSFRQALSIGGLLEADAVLVDRTDRSALGRGSLRFSDYALLGARVGAEAGDLAIKLDAAPFHFSNDYLPISNIRGGVLRADTGRFVFAAFQGRNEQFQGIRLPTVTFAPDYMTGGTALFRATDALSFDASALTTENRQAASNPLFGVEIPRHAETVGGGGTLRLSPFWTAAAKASYARYEYAPGSAYASGSFLSYVVGAALDSPGWKGEANYLRQGVNVVPLSTASVGNREGPHVLLQSIGDRFLAAGSFSSYRNNLESNPGIPNLRSESEFVSALYRVTPQIAASGSLNRQDLTSDRAGLTSRFRQTSASGSVGFPTFGSTRLRYRYQTTEEPDLHQRLHELEVEQQPPPLLGVSLSAGVRLQRDSTGSSSVLYRGSLSGSLGPVSLSASGEWGRDLGASSVFALNRTQMVTAGASVTLPGEIELRVEGNWNRNSAVVNPESIFVSQATQEQLYSFNRHAVLVRLSRGFRWGRNPPGGIGPAESRPYGAVQGFIYQDSNGNGRRDPGELPTPGITVKLDDGQTAKSDASGRFVFPNVIEGDHRLQIDVDVLPSVYNPPSQTAATVRVERLAPGQHDFALLPTGSISGQVLLGSSTGERAGFGGAIVTLLPSEFSTYTDSEGKFVFSNLAPGPYSVRLEEGSLPDGAVVDSGASEERRLSGSQDLALAPFLFSQPIEEKPILKVFEREQGVTAPPASQPQSRAPRPSRCSPPPSSR